MLGCPCCIYNNWFLSMILRCWGPCWPCMFKGAQHVTHGWPAQIWSLLVILYMAFLHLTTVINFLGHKCCRDSFLGLCTLLHSTCNLMHKSHVCWYVLVNTTKKKKKHLTWWGFEHVGSIDLLYFTKKKRVKGAVIWAWVWNKFAVKCGWK